MIGEATGEDFRAVGQHPQTRERSLVSDGFSLSKRVNSTGTMSRFPLADKVRSSEGSGLLSAVLRIYSIYVSVRGVPGNPARPRSVSDRASSRPTAEDCSRVMKRLSP